MSRELFKRAKPGKQISWSKNRRVKLRDRLKLLFLVFKAILALTVIVAAALIYPIADDKVRGHLYQQDALSIKKLILEGNSLVSRDEILEKLEIHAGQNLMDIDLRELVLKLEQLPAVRSALIRKHYPSALHIKVVERVPLMIAGRDNEWLVDDEGIIIGNVESADGDLLTVTGIDIEKQDNVDKKAVEIVSNLREASISARLEWPGIFTLLDLTRREDPIFYLKGDVPVYLGVEDYREKVNRLARVLPSLAGNNISLSYIDLRFDQRVVVGTNQDKGQSMGKRQVRKFG